MNALRPIYRELAILYYRWARKDLRLQPLHPDLPLVVIRLNDLMAERPRPRLHTRDGGHDVHDEISFRIDPVARQAELRPRLALWGALLVVLLAAAMRAAGIPVVDLF
jgi:hypothetical protein